MSSHQWPVIFLLVSSTAASAGDDAFFEKQIRPLLVNRCYACHSDKKTSGGLSLQTRAGWQRGGESGPVIVPGKPDESLLIEAINYRTLEMPPRDKGGPLSDAEIAALTQWVAMGAADPREESAMVGGMSEAEATAWWSFQPLPLSEAVRSSQQIDDFIDARHVDHLLVANGPADRRTLIRRASYDLTGLPPTPDQVKQFLEDRSDDAFAKVVDRLLDSPQYGVKWGRHWLDVVRYADTAGENTDRPLPHAWRYRNWVFESMNRDLPFDEFVRMQLAGDILLANGSAAEVSDGIVATGYLAIARRFGHDIDKDIHLMYEDVIDNVGKNLLGITVGCARCHDHKYDPVTAQDYYALYGIFSSTRFSFPGCEAKGQPRDLVPLLPDSQVDDLMNAWRQRNAKAEAEKKQLEDSLAVKRDQWNESVLQSSRVLATANVGEGESVSFHDAKVEPLDRVAVSKGEVLLLTVFPNDSHGADSTLVEWRMADVDRADHTWNLTDLIPSLLQGNPRDGHHGSSWCFVELQTDGPRYLGEKQEAVDGQRDLSAWRLGDTPSVFVNRSSNPVQVWTSLPAESFFVHPGVDRPVTVAWVCGQDAVVGITGGVTDAHPAGGDGVAFQLQHITDSNLGPVLVELGGSVASPQTMLEPAPQIPVAYAVVEATAQDVRLHQRGDPQQPGEIVPRRWLSILGGDVVDADGGSGRRQLGDWIAHHPLAARVMVNRIWQWHFGKGLVATPNDFGSRGQRPTHPELLDKLAAGFVADHYSVKRLHRMIMNTAAYQRSSFVSELSAARDPDNRYLARFNRRRLDAEEIRDSLLFAAGNLDITPAEGHPFPAVETWKFTQHDPFHAIYDHNKRSAYLMVLRQRRHPYLALFDGADPNASTAMRQVTNVPTQALYFLNAPFFHEQAQRFSQRVVAAGRDSHQAQSLSNLSDEGRMDLAFELLYQRKAMPTEREQGTRFLQQYPGDSDEKWAAFARVLLAANEFLHLD